MTEAVQLFTIGFTQKSAQKFFDTLRANSISTILDTRLNNTGQLAGFSKRDDLEYFCKTICNTKYIHWEETAPEASMLSAYKKKEIKWEEYADEYLSMLKRRKVEKSISLIFKNNSCLLCSEAKPHNCHRSILANYLKDKSDRPVYVNHLL